MRDEGRYTFDLPEWELRRIHCQLGFRLPKFVKLEKPKVVSIVKGYTPIQVKSIKGNLPMADYRFWYGEEFPEMRGAKCRVCKTWTWNAEARKQHMNVEPVDGGDKCSVRLVKAYKKLLVEGKCLVCQKVTKGGKWGVPLCESEFCLKVWMFKGDVGIPGLERELRGEKDNG